MLKLKDFLGLLSAADRVRCFDSTGELICLETVEQLRQKPVRYCPVLRYKEDANCYTMWLDTHDMHEADEYALCEVVADIAMEAALMTETEEICCEDSRDMVQYIYKCAKDYEAKWNAADPDGQNPDYLEDIEMYAREQLLAEYKNPDYKEMASDTRKLSHEEIARALPGNPAENGRFWYDGNYILCKTIDEANTVADFLEAIGVSDTCVTGTFDAQNDHLDGWSYVDC